MSKRKSDSISPPPLKRRRTYPDGVDGIAPVANGLTVLSWNVNGIQPFLQQTITAFFPSSRPEHGSTPRAQEAPARTSLRDFLRRHQWPTLLFLQEVKIDPSDTGTVRALERAVKADPQSDAACTDYVVHVCLPADKYNARGFGGRVYGVASIVRKDFHDDQVERVREVDWDSEGRFLVIETHPLPNGPKLAFINVYAVNGTENPYKSSASGAVIGTRHDRKLQVHALLQAECRKLEREGFGVVLAGDMNIARTHLDGYPSLRTYPAQHCINRADFEKRFFCKPQPPQAEPHLDRRQDPSAETESTAADADDSLGMIDTFRACHPEKRGYTYYPRGRSFGESCDRVDMIVISSLLERYLVSAGMNETPADRGPSDHVPLFASLNFAGSARTTAR